MTSGSPKDRQELIDELHRLAGKLKRTPRMKDLREHGRYSSSPYRNRFGSWNQAIEKAGFEPNVRSKISRQDLLKDLRRLHDELGRIPRHQDIEEKGQYSPNAYYNRFGSLAKAAEEAGFQPDTQEIGREKLIEDLHELAEEIERTPRTHDVEEKAPHSPSAYRREFGSWNDALRTAGFDPNLEIGIPKPNLVAEIKRLADGDEPPTSREMGDRGKYSVSAYLRAFDKWNDAVEKAGYKPRQETDGEGVDPNGYEYERYGSDWTEKSYRIRDEYDECPACGRAWSTLDALNIDFEVHHVRELDVDLEETPIEYDEEPSGYIPLCRECHDEWEGVGIGPDFRPSTGGNEDDENECVE